LRREFVEEAGIVIVNPSLLRAASARVRYVSDGGDAEELHHLGLIYTVAVEGREGFRN
jgi:8-oxo-dGTP pyrophosphatase MutT (NUDIX family)